MSEFGETIRKLGKTVLDVSTDILPNGEHKFALEVSISIDNVDTCKVILYVQLLQVDDNSKYALLYSGQWQQASIQMFKIGSNRRPKTRDPRDIRDIRNSGRKILLLSELLEEGRQKTFF